MYESGPDVSDAGERHLRVLLLSNLYPTPEMPTGGIFVVHRIRALRALGHAITPVALHLQPGDQGSEPRPFSRSESPDDPFHHLMVNFGRWQRVKSRLGLLDSLISEAASSLLHWLDATEFDLIHAHGMFGLPAGAVAMEVGRQTGLPFAVTLHGSDVNNYMKRRRGAYVRVLGEATRVAFVSRSLRGAAVQLGVDPTNTVVIPNGVDHRIFRPLDAGDTREATLRDPVVTYAGNLLAVKGADRLPAIMRSILSRVPAAHFHIVGDGPLDPQIRRRTRGLPVTHHGRLSQEAMARILGQSDLVIIPSRSEGWGCVAIEAHACGVPVLATDAGGLAEALGNSGPLITQDAHIAESFGVAAQRLLNSTSSPDWGLVARSRSFSWSHVAAAETKLLYSPAVEVT